MLFPKTSSDLLSWTGDPLKDQFIMSANYSRNGDGHHVLDIAGCPLVAQGHGVLDSFDITDGSIPLKNDFVKNTDGPVLMGFGAYGWLNSERLVLLERTGGFLGGFKTCFSGFCDALPSQVLEEEVTEESPICWRGINNSNTLVVGALMPKGASHEQSRHLISIKQSQLSNITKEARQRSMEISSIMFQPVYYTPRLQDHSLYGFGTVVIKDGDDIIETLSNVHVFHNKELNTVTAHRSIDIHLPEGVTPVYIDGEGFERPVSALTRDEFVQASQLLDMVAAYQHALSL